MTVLKHTDKCGNHSRLHKSHIFSLCFLGRACPDPGNPKDGRRFGDSFDVGKRVRFRCNPGYKMVGSPSATCLSTLQWNVRAPKCQGLFLFIHIYIDTEQDQLSV